MDFYFYNVTYVRGFTSILTVVCENNIMMWLFPAASKQSHVHIIRFIITTFKNEQHPCKFLRVDEYVDLSNSTDITNLLVDPFKISMETTGGDASCINGNN